VFPFTKRDEAQTGADWEWWFCDWPEGVGFRVQAKRLFADRWYFNSSKFPVRGRSQTDALVERAGPGVLPLYCFYVFQSRRHRSPELRLDAREGCRLMRADTVARVRSKLAKNLMPHSVPWHDSVCGDECRDRDLEAIAAWANGLDETVAGAASRVQPLPPHVEPLVLERKRHATVDDQLAGLRMPYGGAHPIRGVVTINVR
jgi:hypothetical protein